MSVFESDRVYKEFGAYITYHRKKKGMLQYEVAKKVGVTPSYYHYIENGSRKIGFPLILTICSVLDADPNDFILSLTKKKPPVIRPEDEEKEEGAFE